jgi:predicted membrane-bound spermidine synthase
MNRLELVAFICGFVLMVFELAGARILAPGIGSSTYVWTSVIGVIIAALSLGYWVGGIIADRRGYMIDIARVTLVTGLSIALMMTQYEGVIQWVAEAFDDPRLQGVIASLILFAPTSFLLGTISPYLAKLNVRSLETTGSSIASLSALNSIGGIVGTFMAGFVLFSYVGSYETFGVIAITMVAISWLTTPPVDWKMRALVSVGVILFVVVPSPNSDTMSIDTPSAHYGIYDTGDKRLLVTGPSGAQSGISLVQKDKLVFWYTQQLANIVAHAQKRQNILILGGGAFTLPQYLALKYKDSKIDVIEIDPALANIASKHFDYQDPSNINLIFADARAYLNQTDKQYDIVIVDVYGDTHIPFTLLTREYGDHINRVVSSQGIVAANLLAGMESECKTLFKTLDSPYRAHFGYASYKMEYPEQKRSNIIALYSRGPTGWPGSQPLQLTGGTLYNDNFSPAERLQHDCRRSNTSIASGRID